MKRLNACLWLGALALCLVALSPASHAEEGVLVIPPGAVSIEEAAFEGVTGVSAAVVPASVEIVGDRAFLGMSNLKEITFEGSDTAFGMDVLDGCADALLVKCPPDSAAMAYAISNRLDYDADTACRALVIGENYRGTKDALSGPETDAPNVKAMLTRLTGRPYDVTLAMDATASQIDGLIQSTFANAQPQDISIFYYSGHGSAGGNLLGGDRVVYTPARLRQQLDNIPGRKVILVDACYSGGMLDDGDTVSAAGLNEDALTDFGSDFIAAFRPTRMKRAAFNPSDYYVMTACRWDQESESVGYDLGNGGELWYGLFTYYLCSGCGWELECGEPVDMLADADEDGAVSIMEAATYIEDSIWDFFDAWGWDQSTRQIIQAYPENCAWFAPFRN